MSAGDDPAEWLDPNLSESARTLLVNRLPEGGEPTITNMDQSMTESTAKVSIELPQGGTVVYDVTFSRSANHIGWVVSSIEMERDGAATLSDGGTGSADASDTAADEPTAQDADQTASIGEDADDASALVVCFSPRRVPRPHRARDLL